MNEQDLYVTLLEKLHHNMRAAAAEAEYLTNLMGETHNGACEICDYMDAGTLEVQVTHQWHQPISKCEKCEKTKAGTVTVYESYNRYGQQTCSDIAIDLNTDYDPLCVHQLPQLICALENVYKQFVGGETNE